MKFILLLLLSVPFAHAQKAKVIFVDENIDGSSLKKNFDIQKDNHESSIPNKELRDEVLKGVKATEKMDELDKDIFYMDLKSKSLKDLKKKYPQISEKELQFLKDKR